MAEENCGAMEVDEGSTAPSAVGAESPRTAQIPEANAELVRNLQGAEEAPAEQSSQPAEQSSPAKLAPKKRGRPPGSRNKPKPAQDVAEQTDDEHEINAPAVDRGPTRVEFAVRRAKARAKQRPAEPASPKAKAAPKRVRRVIEKEQPQNSEVDREAYLTDTRPPERFNFQSYISTYLQGRQERERRKRSDFLSGIIERTMVL